MRTVLFLCLCALWATASAGKRRKQATKFREQQAIEPTDDADKDHETFLSVVEPSYVPDKHHRQRKANFMKCRNETLEWDPDAEGHAKQINRFCHWTKEEIEGSLNKKLNNRGPTVDVDIIRKSMRHLHTRQPSSVNWTAAGAVTPVQDQGGCSSCYAFGAVAALEGQYAIKGFGLVPLSQQQYVDCAKDYWTYFDANLKATFYYSPVDWNGCNGGCPEYQWSYNNLSTPQNSYACYPYTGTYTTCKANTQCSVMRKVRGAGAAKGPTDILWAVANVGPVACALNAYPIMSYGGGILKSSACADKSLNHIVTIVGYGTSSGQPYWLIKNSWGTGWGERGYARIYRGDNQCGLETFCVWPII